MPEIASESKARTILNGFAADKMDWSTANNQHAEDKLATNSRFFPTFFIVTTARQSKMAGMWLEEDDEMIA
jgi:hypothetical protein